LLKRGAKAAAYFITPTAGAIRFIIYYWFEIAPAPFDAGLARRFG